MNDVAIQSSPFEGLRELALFAGAGGGILGGKLLGWKTVCAVEREAHAAQVLAQRQNDGALEAFPIWSDVSTFDGKPWAGLVDVVSGGFPCQDISSAGKGVGIDGKRSGLWSEMARIVGEVRPRYVYVENSPLLVSRGLALVLSDLAEMGYDAVWGVMGAADVGAPHQRDRCWILAYASDWRHGRREQQQKGGEKKGYVPNSTSKRQQGSGRPLNGMRTKQDKKRKTDNSIANSGWSTEPSVGRVANGVAYRADRLKAIGNGQVPAVAAKAFLELHSYMLHFRDNK